jgi:proteasome accessory factor C
VSATERLSRLLVLVPWLRARPGVTLAETAAHFAISEEQLEADLNLLVCSGLPGHGPDQLIDIDFWNEDGSIHVIDPLGLTSALRLTTEEVTALLVGLRILEQIPGDHDRSALVRLAAKLAGGEGGYADDVIVHVTGADDGALRSAVTAALQEGSGLTITYAGAARDDVTTRTIWPRSVSVESGITYVIAWCDLAGSMRTFRIDRILGWEPTATGPQPGADGESREDRVTVPVTLELEESVAWFAEVHGGRPGGSPGQVVIDVYDIDWAARAVLALGGGARLVDPPAAVERLVTLAGSALARYSGTSPS